MPNRVIDEMPTMQQVEDAGAYEIVCWNHYLRPVMSNDELVVVKAIDRRYQQLNEITRNGLVVRARKEYTI
jgi:tyrosine-protein phosphatase YwqE